MKRNILLPIILMIGLLLSGSAAHAQSDSAAEVAHWEAWFDQQMAAHQVPGAVFALVKDGQIVFTSGYGVADLETGAPVDPETTLFHLGSLSKIMTATAVMAMVEDGTLALDKDVANYLTVVTLDTTMSRPITLFDLLTHTSGIEQHGLATAVRDEADYLTLPDYFTQRPPRRLLAPGAAIVYSSAGMALAGQVVAEQSGLPFADAMQQTVFAPLAMDHSAFLTPPANPAEQATGYRPAGDTLIAYDEPYYSLLAPGGDFVSSGSDMGHFVLMQLNNGRFQNRQLFAPETIAAMHNQQVSQHPALRGRAIGFSEWVEMEQRALFHDGGAPGFLSRVFLLPEANVGFFVSHTNGNAYDFNRELSTAVIERYTSAETAVAAPEPTAGDSIDLQIVSGYYADYDLSPFLFGKINSLFNQFPVTVSADSATVSLGSRAYQRVADNLYEDVENGRRLTFATLETAQGPVIHLLRDTAAYRQTGWFERQPVQLAWLGVTLLLFMSMILAAIWGNWRKTPGNGARWLGALLAGINTAFIISLAANLSVLATSDIWALTYGLTPGLRALFWLPWVAVGLTAIMIVFAVRVWRYEDWSRNGCVHYAIVTAASVGFIGFLNYWQLLIPVISNP